MDEQTTWTGLGSDNLTSNPDNCIAKLWLKVSDVVEISGLIGGNVVCFLALKGILDILEISSLKGFL